MVGLVIIKLLLPIIFSILCIALLVIAGLYISFSKRTLYLNRKDVEEIVSTYSYDDNSYKVLKGIIASRRELSNLIITILLLLGIFGFIIYKTSLVNSEEIKLSQEISYRLYTTTSLNLNKLSDKLEPYFTEEAYYKIDPTNVYNIADRHLKYNRKNTKVKILETFVKDNKVFNKLEVITDNVIYNILTEVTFDSNGKIIGYDDYLLNEIVEYE